MSRRFAALLFVLVTVCPLAAAEKEWTGQKVMPKKQGIKLGDWDANDQQKFFEPIEVVYTVTKEKDGWLRLRCAGQEGWGTKSEWVLLADAPAHYAVFIRADANNSWAWNNRGIAWEELGEYENAIKDYTETIRLSPNDAAGYDNRGNVYKLTKEYDRAIRDFTQAIRLSPDSALIYNNRAGAYERMREYDKAIEDYSTAIRLDPKYALGLKNRGAAWRFKKDYARAVADLSEAIRLDPNYADAFNERGLAHMDAKENDKAKSDFDRALRIDPKHVNSLTNRANLFREQKEYDQALADYNAALKIDPKFALAYRNRGELWWNQKEYAKAAKDFAEAAKIDPKDFENLNQLAWFLATCASDDHRDGKKAVELAIKACEITEWKQGNPIDTLASAYAEAGEFDKAIKYAKKVLESDDVDAKVLAEVRKRLKDFEGKKPHRSK